MKVSDCCGASPISNGDMSFEDIGICSECREHCEYVEEEDELSPIHIELDESVRTV